MSHAVPTKETRRRHSVGTKHRGEDVADALGISQGKLVAALVSETGQRRTVVGPTHADVQMPATVALAEFIPLARNLSAIHESVGTYRNEHPGAHSAMVLINEGDVRNLSRQSDLRGAPFVPTRFRSGGRDANCGVRSWDRDDALSRQTRQNSDQHERHPL
ncbi:MAG: hypothetical protein AAGF68_05520, partial [Pseudomonadota bacterium]